MIEPVSPGSEDRHQDSQNLEELSEEYMPVCTLDANVVRDAVCPPDKRKIDMYDTAITGFILEVRSTGTKTYYLKYRNARKQQRQFKIGDEKSLSFREASAAAQKLRAKVVLGKDPVEDRSESRKMITMGEFVRDRYLPFVKGYKKSWDCDDSLLRNHVLPAFEKKYLDEITPDDLVGFQKKKLAGGYAPTTVNRIIVLTRYLFNLAMKWDLLPGVRKNPASETRLFKDNKKERFLSHEESLVLMEKVRNSKNPQLKFIVPLLLLLGCRKRELLDAKWDEFDLDLRIWRIPKSKTGVRHVPVSEAVLAIFRELPRWEGCPYVIPNPKTKKPFVSFFHSWDTARKEAGMPELRVHDLRHSLASFLVNSGRSIYEVQRILGHSQIQTTQRYAHLSQETLLDAVNSVAGLAGLEENSAAAS